MVNGGPRRYLSIFLLGAEEFCRASDFLQCANSCRENIATLFHGIDVLITPTTQIAALRISDLTKDPDALRPAELALLRNTRPVNVWGLPAISVPCGRNSQGLPIGLQIIGPPRGEVKVLQVARAYEEARDWVS